VYETVKLPPKKFTKQGAVNFFHPTQGENALGTEYIYKNENTCFEGVFLLSRWRKEEKIIRRSNGKLLRKNVLYIRTGGDILLPELSASTLPAHLSR
jgi:hypothetical protein